MLVTRAGSKTTTQVARFHSHSSFPGSGPKRFTSENKTIFAYLRTQETLRVIIAAADAADSSAVGISYINDLHF